MTPERRKAMRTWFVFGGVFGIILCGGGLKLLSVGETIRWVLLGLLALSGGVLAIWLYGMRRSGAD